jgi:hypothetical protein
MKRIPLRPADGMFPGSVPVLKAVLQSAPANGLSVGDVKTRIDLIASLEQSEKGEAWDIEDAQHVALLAAIRDTRFMAVDRAIVTVCLEDVPNAKGPSAPAAA